MSQLLPQELIDYLFPAVIQLFRVVDKAQAAEELKEFTDIIKSFINDPSLTMIMIRKTDQLLVHTVLENVDGPILFCHKNSDTLMKPTFLSYLSVIPLAGLNALPIVQAIIGRLYLPLCQNNTDTTDALEVDILEKMTDSNISLSRASTRERYPEPILEIPEEFYKLSSDSKPAPEDESQILIASEKWQTSVGSIISYAHTPPQFDTLQEELNFWPLISTRLQTISSQIDKINSSNIASIITPHRKNFNDFLKRSKVSNEKLSAQVIPFSEALSSFDVSIVDNCNNLIELNDCVEFCTTFFADFFEESTYDFRCVALFNLYNKSLLKNVLHIISTSNLLKKPQQEFINFIDEVTQIISLWKSKNENIRTVLRGSSFVNNIKAENDKLKKQTDKLVSRLKELKEYKVDYHTLLNQIASHPDICTAEMNNKITIAFDTLSSSQLFDFTRDGNDHWDSAIANYTRALAFVETDIARIISTMVTNIKDLFGIQAIFVELHDIVSRPNVRSYLRQSQGTFISAVHDQLVSIQKHDLVNITKQNLVTYLLQKGTSVDGCRLIVIKRAAARVDKLERMLIDVVGERWQYANNCQEIAALLASCREEIAKMSDVKRLNDLFHNSPDDPNAFILAVETRQDQRNLHCKYPAVIQNMLSTYRTAKQMGLQLDIDACANIEMMSQRYVRFIKISETIQSWIEVINSLEPQSEDLMRKISAEYIESIYGLFSETYQKRWNSPQINEFIDKFTETIVEFRTDVAKARKSVSKINGYIEEIRNTDDPEQLKEILAAILATTDQLFCSKFTNDEQFIAALNQKISGVLGEKIAQSFSFWEEKLNNNQPIGEREPIAVRIALSSNQITVTPAVQTIHPLIQRMFTEELNAFLLQMQIFTMSSTSQPLFQEAIPVPQKQLLAIYNQIKRLTDKVSAYVNEWRSLQYFFTADPSSINFEDNIGEWAEFLSTLVKVYQKYRKYPKVNAFGAVVVDTTKIHDIISTKIVEWNKVVAKAGRIRAKSIIATMQQQVNKARAVAEKPIPNTSKELAGFLQGFRSASEHKGEWDAMVPQLADIIKFVKLEEFEPFKNSVEQFGQIYQKRKVEIENNKQQLCTRVEDETETLSKAITKLHQSWDYYKPKDGSMDPEVALQKVKNYDSAFKKNKAAWDELATAREAIGLPIAISSELEGMIEDCATMGEVWRHLTPMYQKMNLLMTTPFAQFVPQEFRAKLISSQEKLQEMPEKIRNYEPWEFYSDSVKKALKVYPTLEGLKSPAVLSRHWKLISQHLKQNIDIERFTISDIIALDLEQNAQYIGEILRAAQGEFSLHQYLESLDMTWNTLEFEFSNYKNKMQLIKSWDVIMTTIADHLNFLGTMQTSPFFHTFRETALQWTARLNQLQVLLDDWLDVQRRFIYLEGVFNSPDIRTILAKATAGFQKSEKEFVKISKQAVQLRLVIKIATISNIGATLTTLNESLLQLQKELSDYLEKQRSFFPRFFFIGDEDLLEIIGKSSQINEIQKHFGKMFEGLSGVKTEGSNIIEMNCSEGESVTLSNPVDTKVAVYQMLSNLENEMRVSLKKQLAVAAKDFSAFWANMTLEGLKKFIEAYSAQTVLLAFFVISTGQTELAIKNNTMENSVKELIQFLNLLSQLVFTDLSVVARHSVQQLITECVHHRNISRELIQVNNTADFQWARFLRFYETEKNELVARIGDAEFFYGFEYLGLTPSLVRTPLTDRVYLTLAQALYAKLGGSPFGPAGTGKTETVKNMGHHLGRHVLVFNCDETFDFKAMGRIFVGLCHCGSWGCFDEFNRLDEQMLSAVSQQIQTIQVGLKANQQSITILGKKAPLNQNIGIFITMNPGYAGRVELPDNLKQLFRTMAMNRPDTELITEVLLFSQGFSSAEQLAPKFVALFQMAKESLSNQTHYDFGLRAMKSVLTNAGQLMRMSNVPEDGNKSEIESKLLISSIVNTLFPKLLASDLQKLKHLIDDVFPGVAPEQINQDELMRILKEEAAKCGWIASDVWVNKIIQLFYIQQINHGFMLVGPSATGKTSARTILLKVLSLLDKQESESYVINPKSVTKDTLFGFLDPVTREWTDGVFTRILRTIVNDQRGEMSKRHWIVFDGDVDPEWVENLNSVLDDNKLLTLPNGERIALPPNVRIVFEVANLNYATPATVSRCGIVFFSDNTLKPDEIISYYMHNLSTEPIITPNHILAPEYIEMSVADMIAKQKEYVDMTKTSIYSMILTCQKFWNEQSENAVMEVPFASCISTLFSFMSSAFVNCLRAENSEETLQKASLFSAFWAFATPFSPEQRVELDSALRSAFPGIAPSGPIAQNIVSFENRDWESVQNSPVVKGADGFVATPETALARFIIDLSFISGRTVVLCGPTGVGKKAMLANALSAYPEVQTINVNLSNCSSIDFLLKTLEQFTIYVKASTSLRMRPKGSNAFLVFICNHLNLPSLDKYGTQRVVEFLRQMLEFNGFWHPQRREWITLEMITFAGVCSPPTTYGRVKLSERFLRHSTVMYIEHPSTSTLNSIVGGLIESEEVVNKEAVAQSVCDFYYDFREKFRASELAHYISNIGDIAQWINSFVFACKNSPGANEGHLLYNEGLRVFNDRLEEAEEKDECRQMLQTDVIKNFDDIDSDIFEQKHVYTRIMDGRYSLVDTDKVVEKLNKKINDYNSESASNELVFFDEAVNLFTNIERRLSEAGGHMLLIGLSGTGKIQMTNFVAWTLDMQVFRMRVHREYTLADFDADLRRVLRACLDGSVCFIIKEDDLILPVFTERLNVLLSESSIPGLFVGDEYQTLIAAAKDAARIAGQLADTDEAAFDFFIERVSTNLHVVQTSNSATVDMNQRDVMFPSLFAKSNICWVGCWSDDSLRFFARHTMEKNELNVSDSVIDAMLKIHASSCETSEQLPVTNYVSPRYFFDFVEQYCRILKEKRQKLHNEQDHLSQGLSKLEETQNEVSKMGTELEKKKLLLKQKEQLAEQKLEEIVKDKAKTTAKKNEAQVVKEELNKKTGIINTEKKKAQDELDAAGPMIAEAAKSVQNIKKSNLDEIRRLASPPEPVKNTLSCVLLLLGVQAPNWAAIRKVISGDSFIKSVVEFNINTCEMGTIKKARALIEATGLTFDAADRASKACGPLFKWISANLKYLEILEKTEPLRQKVAELEKEANSLAKQHSEMSKVITALEFSLKKITQEYQQLNSQCDQTRREAESVQVKLDRAQNLLKSLTSETSRWKERSQSFQTDFANLDGHSILSSAFVAYCGFLEQQRRMDALISWENLLEECSIKYSDEYSFTDFLTDPEQLIKWSDKGLPKDDLCIQNAVILGAQTTRVPLIVDPAGQATNFIVNTHDKIVRTSFVDPKFPKHLESCLRFGTALLVEDGEQMDQLVLPVLAREFKRAGGRVLLDLKRNEIDISPAFQMFIVTKDTDFAPSPSIASMTVLINFSVTSLSLRAQCLTRLLTFKLPDIEKHRQELHQSLAMMQVSLGELEDKMLTVFSETKGEILENDQLLHLLEHIKEEATSIEAKASETRATLQEISETSDQFASVAEVSTALYFALKDMSTVHFLYQFSLQFFWSVFDRTVKEDAPPATLIGMIAKNLFVSASYSILDRHLSVLGFRFGQLLLEHTGVPVDESLYDLALRGSSLSGKEPEFMNLADPHSEWLLSDSPETNIPQEIASKLESDHPAITALMVLAIVRRARPDRIVAAVDRFISSAFGFNVADIPPLDLAALAAECSPTVPLLLCAAAGHDPSDRVESAATKPLDSVAVGAADTYPMIEKAVAAAAQSGHWVIVKNVHLAPYFIRTFVKTLGTLMPHQDFRLFMTSEINPKVGSNVFRNSRIVAFEPATGVRANLRRVTSSGIVWPEGPAERRRLVLNFLWMHAIVVERLRFAPLGWSKTYEFNDSDLRFASQVGLRWLEQAASKNPELKPSEFPWYAIRFLLSESVYGGRIDIPADQRAIRAMAQLLFNPDAKVGEDGAPNVSTAEEFTKWVEALPSNESPEMLWLPRNSGKFLFIQRGNSTLHHILSVVAGSGSGKGHTKQTSFVRALLEQWADRLNGAEVMEFSASSDSLVGAAIADELTQLRRTRAAILADIQAIQAAIANGDALTQKAQKVIESLNKGTVPPEWNAHSYTCADLGGWIDDFCERVEHLNWCAADPALGVSGLKLALFAKPQTLLAAARQAAARANQWPVERTRTRLLLGGNRGSPTDLTIVGLTLLSAAAEDGKLVASNEVINECPPIAVTFVLDDGHSDGVTVPIFTTTQKRQLVIEVELPTEGQSPEWWAVRCPAIILQKNGL